MKEGLLAVAVLVVFGATLWSTHHQPNNPAPPSSGLFDGVRWRAKEVQFVQQVEETGSRLAVCALRMVARDGKVGRIFRSPLKRGVHLAEAEVLLSGNQGVLLEAASEEAEYDPTEAAVILRNPNWAKIGDRDLEVRSLTVRADGTVRIRAPFTITDGGESVRHSQDYAGRVETLIADLLTVAKAGEAKEEI